MLQLPQLPQNVVHGDIRHLETKDDVEVIQVEVHGDIRHLEN